MSTITLIKGRKINWRRIGFLTISAMMLLLRFTEGVLSAAVPWLPQIDPSTPGFTAEIHVWHNAEFGIGSLIAAGVLIALLRRPQEKPMLMQYLLIVNLMVIVLELLAIENSWNGSAAFTAVEIVILSLFTVCYPAPRSLLSFSSEKRPSKPLLILTLLMALFFIPDIVRNIQWQLGGVGSEHIHYSHYLFSIILEISLVLAGWMAATQRSGWQWLGALVGLALLYFGPAATTTGGQGGSWGMTGGILSALLGAAFIAALMYEARRKKPAVPTGIHDNIGL